MQTHTPDGGHPGKIDKRTVRPCGALNSNDVEQIVQSMLDENAGNVD